MSKEEEEKKKTVVHTHLEKAKDYPGKPRKMVP